MATTTDMSKTEYLKKYLSSTDVLKIKKAKKKSQSSKKAAYGIRITEEDAFISIAAPEKPLVNSDNDEGSDEDKPVINLLQCDTEELRLMGKFRSDVFKPIDDARQSGIKTRRSVDSDSDTSPNRRTRINSNSDTNLSPSRASKPDSDRDMSPIRRRESDSKPKNHHHNLESKSSRHHHNSHRKISEGKTAGLQSASALREETRRLKNREEEIFDNITDEVSGRGARTVIRDRKTGKVKDLAKEREKKNREQKHQKEMDDKYAKWNKGVVQLREREEKIVEMTRVVHEPFTRMADDPALNEHLKQAELSEDPMLAYVQKKRDRKNIKAGLAYPRYSGPAPAPNRFSLWPGYRWDGVDRSNGFENKFFSKSNTRKANNEEVYKWSIGMYE